MDSNQYKKAFSNVRVDDTLVDELIQKAIKIQHIGENYKIRKRHRWLIPIIVGVLIISTLTAAAYTTGTSKWFEGMFERDNVELSDEEMEMIDNLGDVINISQTSNGSTLTVLSAIGDQAICFLSCELTIPEGTGMESSGIYVFRKHQLDFKDYIEPIIVGMPNNFIHITSSPPECIGDNKIAFILKIDLPKDSNNEVGNVSMSLEDFGYYGQDEMMPTQITTLVTGQWNFEFEINYSNVPKDFDVDVAAQILEKDATITHVAFTPISLYVDFSVLLDEKISFNKNGGIDKDFKYTLDDIMSTISSRENCYLLTDTNEKIYFSNLSKASETIDQSLRAEICSVSYVFDKPVDTNHIKSIIFQGNEIPLIESQNFE